ncbi:hypothetical protein ACSNOH_01455 [Streptomyces sp. URMC 127]|uniref:hypothetical protein n=1 Tax=Streptomyces sp. URMC 127 TaxID=3423402 RepID=UPI003F1C6640
MTLPSTAPEFKGRGRPAVTASRRIGPRSALLSPTVLSEEVRDARRTLAYRLAAFDALPRPVRLSAAAALEVIGWGTDVQEAASAMKDSTARLTPIRLG